MRALITSERDRDKFIRQVKETELGDKTFVASFSLYRKKRSLPANNLYWKWLRLISEETGNSPDDMHAYYGEKFLPYKSIFLFGKESSRQMTSSELDTKQFSEYMEMIKFDALHNLDIVLPEPDDRGWEQFILQYGGK